MPYSSDNRPGDGRHRSANYDGLRELERRMNGRGRGSDGAGRRQAEPAGARSTAAGTNRAGTPGPRALRQLRGLRRRWPRRLLVTINVFVALCLVGAAGAYGYVRHELGNVKKVSLNTLTYSKGTFTVLIVGSDTRALTGSGNAQFGSAAETPGQRSDTIMLARIVPATRSMTFL